MTFRVRVAAAVLLGGAAWGLAQAGAALGDPPADEVVQDRTGFIPHRKHQLLQGTAVGIPVSDPQPVLGTEGRSGAVDNLCFAAGGASYRWVYVPTFTAPQITNLQVPLGDGQVRVYPALDMANLKTVSPWGITAPYTLVRVEVNSGRGSPAGDSFVATDMKALEGTKEYPLKTAEVIARLRQRYAAYVKDQDGALKKAMAEAQKKALQGRKATGPREKSELMFVT